METIYVNPNQKHDQNSFLMIVPTSSKHVLNQPYIIADWFSKSFMGTKYLVSKKIMEFQEITDFESYLAMDCDKKLLFKIFKERYKHRLNEHNFEYLPNDLKEAYRIGDLYTFITRFTMMDLLVFADKSCVKSLYNPSVIEVDVKSSLLSKKTILTKNYCHKSKWNKEAQRPYTEQELKELNHD